MPINPFGRTSRIASRAGRAESYRSPDVTVERLEDRIVLSSIDAVGMLPVGEGLDASVFGPRHYERVEWTEGEALAVPDSWVLTFNEPLRGDTGEARAHEVVSQLGATPSDVQVVGLGYSVSVTLDDLDLDRVEEVIAARPDLKAVEPNILYFPHATPNDPLYTNQYWLNNTGQEYPFSGIGVAGADVNAQNAWDITTGSSSVIIAVLDTGVDLDHPDLAANIWTNPGEIPGNNVDDDGNGFIDDVNGWDFGELDNNPDDFAGHGTQVAGMIGAVGNNGIGVSGIAWNVSILPLKIADPDGGLTLEAIIGAHDYVTLMRGTFGHNIVASNNSYGGYAQTFFIDAPTGFDAERDAIERSTDIGTTVVTAAGNESFDTDNPTFTSFPSSYNLPGLISVAATTNQDTLAGFSNFGQETVDIGAPGQDVFTTANGGNYTLTNGTSFSSPLVAGAIALMATVKPGASGVELRQALIDSADPIPALQLRTVSGGRLNVERALQTIGIDGPVVRRIDPGPVTGQFDTQGDKVDSITVEFNKEIDASLLDPSNVTLLRLGPNVEVPVTGVSLGADGVTVTIDLDLSGFPLSRLPLATYRLTLNDAGFRDLSGNRLNGNSSAGVDEIFGFEVVAVTGSYEQNDTLATARLTTFDASGRASFLGASVGDGLFTGTDVDLFRIELPRAGLIAAEVFAQRLNNPSGLDAQLRLFDASGNELAANDQFFGNDPFLDLFVSTAGTYYVGVSGFGNANYLPEIAGSGAVQSTGPYDLRLDVQLIGDDRISSERDLSGSPMRIPAQGTGGSGVPAVIDTIEITDARQIQDVNLNIDLEHTFVQDLEIVLMSPAGTEVLLFNNRGGNGSNLTGTRFDDEAVTAVSNGDAPFAGAFRPDVPLNRFDGQSAAGTWTLMIFDTAGLNFGQLNSWEIELTLQNDIFGPFELNDTLATARTLETIVGTGSAAIGASIGDGGFGKLDRDLFRFTVDAGTTLNAEVTSVGTLLLQEGETLPTTEGATLNTAIRLFDDEGNEIKSSNPGGTLNSVFDSFVFGQGGTFYIAVSESNNVDYDPFIVTSGKNSITTGDYVLQVTVAAGVSDSDVVLVGDQLAVGFDSDGTFARGQTGTPGIALNANEFLFGSGFGGRAFFSGTAGGYNFLNDGTNNPSTLPVALTDQSDNSNQRVSVSGDFRGLAVERSLSFAQGDAFVAIDVLLRNDSMGTLNDIGWSEGFNPVQGLGTELQTLRTTNDVGSPFATAQLTSNLFPGGLTISLAAPDADTRAFAAFVNQGAQIRDPGQLLALSGVPGAGDPDGLFENQLMTMSFDIGTLAPGETTTFRYFVLTGESFADVQAMYDAINDGTGTGHLASSASDPGDETLSDGSSVPVLPYEAYYPEGFANAFISTFVPVLNPHNQDTRVVIIARYETGVRDQVLADFVLEPNARGGITINTPELFAAGQSMVRPNEPYSLEIRSDKPVGAMFSHYDTFLLGETRAAVGEAFTSSTSRSWSFGEVSKGAQGTADFILFQNVTDEVQKIKTFLYPTGGGERIELTLEVEPYRRAGWNLNAETGVPAGEYAVLIDAPNEIIAAVSSFDQGLLSGQPGAYGAVGLPSAGATSGVIPEGQFGLNATMEKVSILNPNGATANVTFSFLFPNGSAYRTTLAVAANSRGELDVATLNNFPVGSPYSILYDSDQAVSLTLPARAFGDTQGASFATAAHTVWAFGEGFRPRDEFASNVTEYLRVFNPNDTSVLIEITMLFDGDLGSETFRQEIGARRVAEFNIHDFVTGDRREQPAFFGFVVKGADPIVAYMGHFDRFFPGSFGTLGTPFGQSMPI